jgi:HEAT repeat protein
VRAIGPAKSIPFLLQWIKPPHKDSQMPGGAVGCFQIFGPDAGAAIPELAKMLRPGVGADTLANASEALSYLGPDAVPVLLTAATNFERSQIQWEIIQDIANFGTNGAAAKPAILKWSKSTNVLVRLGAMHAYLAIEGDKTAKVAFLLNGLKDPEESVRSDAAEFLGDVGQGQENLLPAMLHASEDPSWQVQSSAIEGLGKLGVNKPLVLPLLVKKLHDNDKRVRRCAAFALGDLGGTDSFDALMSAVDDPDEFVRGPVFHSLEKIDPVALARSGKTFH